MRETGRGLLHSRKSSDGLNGRSRRHHAGFGAAQCGNPAHARVNAVQAITVESDGQKILEIEHHQSIKSVPCHADKKGPLRIPAPLIDSTELIIESTGTVINQFAPAFTTRSARSFCSTTLAIDGCGVPLNPTPGPDIVSA